MTKKNILVAIIVISLFACKKSNTDTKDTDNGLPTAPETKPQYDNTAFGVYKGVIIGSSGYIIFRINNGDNIVKGYLTMDNQKDTLTTTTVLVSGQPISNILFTGRISSMRLSANANGSNSTLSEIRINGHNNVTGFISHEESTKQVFCYEGTFSGGINNITGIINATRVGTGKESNDTTWMLAKLTNDSMLYRGYGWVNKDTTYAYLNGYRVGQPADFSIKGTGNSNLNILNGTWSGYFGKGEFTSKRTY